MVSAVFNTEHQCDSDDEGAALLLQQDRRSAHEGDASPVPDHDDEDAGCEERLHGKPNFCEASVLMDALVGETNISINYSASVNTISLSGHCQMCKGSLTVWINTKMLQIHRSQ